MTGTGRHHNLPHHRVLRQVPGLDVESDLGARFYHLLGVLIFTENGAVDATDGWLDWHIPTRIPSRMIKITARIVIIVCIQRYLEASVFSVSPW